MNAQKLQLENGTVVEPALCGTCKRVWESADSAERCCTCSFCGEPCPWENGHVSHDACGEKRSREADAEALAKATLVSDYKGSFLLDDRIRMDITELLDGEEITDIPEEGFCATFQQASLELSDLMDNLSEQHHEDFEADGVEELEEAIAAFNKKNESNGTWWEDRERKWSKALVLAGSHEPSRNAGSAPLQAEKDRATTEGAQ